MDALRARSHNEVAARAMGQCERCGAGTLRQHHHVTPKGIGGRGNDTSGEAASQLAELCVVCHGADHHLRIIVSHNGQEHSCRTCWRLPRCAPGQAVQ